ncbi:MAG: prepilin-type N-terminal cleavage/methylation domain-containing protein [bacterium]|nr:prepilin-type N-terminal cleavage/methylation domain-containing protein [bacterium]
MFTKPLIGKLTGLNGNQGFSFIETMIAMTILTIGMLSVAAMQVRSTQGNTSANRSTRGFIWCSDRIEVLKSLPYTDPALIGTPGRQEYSLPQTADGIDNDYDGQIDEAGEDGDIDLLYTVADDVVEPNTKLIEVTAIWQSGQNSLTLTTVRARNDVF